MTDTKRAHGLFRHRDAAAFLSGLRAEGIDFDELMARFIDSRQPHSVLLVGSLSERTGNAASDVDILVILQDDSALRIDGAHPRLDHGKSFEVLTYENGIEFNIKFVQWRDVLPVKQMLGTLLEGIGNPAGISSVPFLPNWELRFLHKLRTGWSLAGTDLAGDWNEALMTNLLPSYLAVRHFNEFDEWLEDAGAMRAEHPDAAICAARSAAQASLLALLAGQGFTSPSHKWIFHWMDQCGDPAFADIFAQGKAIILDAFRGREDELLEKTRMLGERIAPVIAKDPVVSIAITRLRRMVSYLPAS